MWTMEVHNRTPPPKQSKMDVKVALHGNVVCFLLASVDSFMYFLKHIGSKPRRMGMNPVKTMVMILTTASSMVDLLKVWRQYYIILSQHGECPFGTGGTNSLALYIPGGFHIWHPHWTGVGLGCQKIPQICGQTVHNFCGQRWRRWTLHMKEPSLKDGTRCAITYKIKFAKYLIKCIFRPSLQIATQLAVFGAFAFRPEKWIDDNWPS